MLLTTQTLKKMKVISCDGNTYDIKDLYFDDSSGALRFIVISSGHWIHLQQKLISPFQIKNINIGKKEIHLELSHDKLRESPDPKAFPTVSREFERMYANYYIIPPYWVGEHPWGIYQSPMEFRNGSPQSYSQRLEQKNDYDQRLRSIEEVKGYSVEATDGEVGKLEEFIVNIDNWILTHLIVDKGKYLWNKDRVMGSITWLDKMSWIENKVFLNVDKETVIQSAKFLPTLPVNKIYEEKSYDLEGKEQNVQTL